MNYCCTIELHKLIRNFLPCSKGELNLQHAKCSFTLVLSYPEDGKRRLVQNVDTSELKYTTSHRKLYIYHEDRGNELLWKVYMPACLPDCMVSANDVHLNINRIQDFKLYIMTHVCHWRFWSPYDPVVSNLKQPVLTTPTETYVVLPWEGRKDAVANNRHNNDRLDYKPNHYTTPPTETWKHSVHRQWGEFTWPVMATI